MFVEDIEHDMIKILENKNIEAVILNVGINNIASKHSGRNFDTDIFTKMLNIIAMCRSAGINDVFFSGITCLPTNQNKIDNINELLKSNAERYEYTFIDNGNILAKRHLWKDKLHLNTDVNVDLIQPTIYPSRKTTRIRMLISYSLQYIPTGKQHVPKC